MSYPAPFDVEKAETAPHPATTALACLAFFASGVAALLYQVSWQRMLGVFSGIHTWSVTIIVSAFMAGLGVGAIAGGRVARVLRTRAAAAGTFAAAELALGLIGTASPLVLYRLPMDALGALVRTDAAIPFVHFSLLLLPTTLMGASLPLLARALVAGTRAAAGSRLTLLYGLNTLGASAGAFAGAWYLAGRIGFAGMAFVGAGLNGIAAVAGAAVALRLRRSGGGEEGPERPAAEEPAAHPFPWEWIGLAAVTGFLALCLEMLWIRVLNTSVKALPYGFGHTVGILLLFQAAGAICGGRLLRRRGDPARLYLWSQWAICVSAAVAIGAFLRWMDHGSLPDLWAHWNDDDSIHLSQIVAAASEWRATGSPPGTLKLAATLWIALPVGLAGLPSFLMGLSYGWLQSIVQTEAGEVPWRVGALYGANVLGCVAGALATGCLLFDALGTPAIFRAVALAGIPLGALAARRLPGGVRVPSAIAAGLAAAAAAAVVPGTDVFWSALHGSRPDAVAISEDASSVVVMQRRAVDSVLRVNGIGHSLVPYGTTWTTLGIVPPLLQGSTREALLIGMGSGATAWAVSRMPGVERIDLYEIARPERMALVDAESRWLHSTSVAEFLAERRIRLAFTDGRLALRLPDRAYDLVEADPVYPDMQFSGNLQSREFFEEVRSRLRPGGVFAVNHPTDRSRRTALSVFPYALDLGYFFVLANEPLTFDRDVLLARLWSPATRDALRTSPRGTAALAEVEAFLKAVEVRAWGPADPRPEGDVNTDLFPRDEFDWRTP